MADLWQRLVDSPVWVKVVAVLVGLVILGGILGEEEPEDGEEPTAGKAPPPKPEKVTREDVAELLTPALVVELAGNERQFCRAYARALGSGFSEDFAFGNFLRGYRREPGGPSAQEVFDEYVSRC